MEAVIVAECNQEARQYEENTYTDVELRKKPLDNMGKPTIENIGEMGDEYQVGRQCAHPC